MWNKILLEIHSQHTFFKLIFVKLELLGWGVEQ